MSELTKGPWKAKRLATYQEHLAGLCCGPTKAEPTCDDWTATGTSPAPMRHHANCGSTRTAGRCALGGCAEYPDRCPQ